MLSKLIVGIILVLATGGLWVYNSRHTTPPTYSGPKEPIAIANIGEFTIFNIIAEKKGFFDQYGLDAQVTEHDAGPSAMKALHDGTVDIAVASDFVGVNNIFTHPELRIIAEASRHQVIHVVARTNKGIKEPKDLKGKRIGVTKNSVAEYYLGRYFTFNNIPASSTTITNLSPADIITRLEQGSIDAAVIWDPHAFNLKQKLGGSVVDWPAQGEQFTYDLFYTKESFIAEHPERIRRYLRAIRAAAQFVQDNPDESKTIVKETLKYSDEYTEQVWLNHDFKVGLDQDLLLAMENEAQFVIDRKLTTATDIPNYLNFIYFEGMEAVDPTAITIAH